MIASAKYKSTTFYDWKGLDSNVNSVAILGLVYLAF